MNKNLKFTVLSLKVAVFGLLAAMMFSCQPNYVPKPNAYYRIDFPEKEYRLFDSICPYTFEYPVYGIINPDMHPSAEPYWINISFAKYKGTIHLTYKTIDGDFDKFMEENWKMIYSKIALKADAIDDRFIYENPELKVYGALYDIKGNAASSVQFWLTDSLKNYIRGSFYFSVKPNYDSLAPAIGFFREDIIHLMETFKWKQNNININ